MKRNMFFAALFTMSIATPALAADVSISVGQPGFYGRIDLGNLPLPRVINALPVVIEGGESNRPPIYLHVPPEHAKHWKRHCREYNACGEKVFFVHEDWYNKEYVPRYQQSHAERHEDNRDVHREDRKDTRQDERRDSRQDERRDERRDDRREEHRDER